MRTQTSRPSRRRREQARTAPRMTLLPEPVPGEARVAAYDAARRAPEVGLGPYEARYDVSLGYTSERMILVP